MRRLLDYDGWWYWLSNGWSLRFRMRGVAVSAGRPQGIKYAFTLHDVDGTRLLGFDNAGPVPRQTVFDHRHPFRRVDEHVPYTFVDGDRLVSDFFAAVEVACASEGVPFEIEDEERRVDREEDEDDQAATH
jgi:hypothetical protein